MKILLTSSHTLGWAGDLNPANGLLDELKASLDGPIRCVMVSSYPDDVEITDRMAWEIRECFDRADLPFKEFKVLDRRTQNGVGRMLRRANFIILCGGHVPTENRFFSDLHLKWRLSSFDGVMLTISAGSMNCAETVYSSPELEGESLDPDYQIHMEGLGLTDVNILPHFQTLKKSTLDGRKLVDDIVAGHSWMHPVWCLPDGSYFLIEGDRTELRGKAYRMKDGKLRLVCHDNERKLLLPDGKLQKIPTIE